MIIRKLCVPWLYRCLAQYTPGSLQHKEAPRNAVRRTLATTHHYHHAPHSTHSLTALVCQYGKKIQKYSGDKKGNPTPRLLLSCGQGWLCHTHFRFSVLSLVSFFPSCFFFQLFSRGGRTGRVPIATTDMRKAVILFYYYGVS